MRSFLKDGDFSRFGEYAQTITDLFDAAMEELGG